jgi:hypothetical protein
VDAKPQFRSLAEPWADSGTSTERLMLAVLGRLADVERDLIRTRTACSPRLLTATPVSASLGDGRHGPTPQRCMAG